MLSVYVMGSSRDLARVVPIVERVKAHPRMRLEHDWTRPVIARVAVGKTDADLSLGEAERHARDDLWAVRAARVRWLLMPPASAPSRGAWVEFGHSLYSGRDTIVSGPGTETCIFTRLADWEFATDEEAWEWLDSRAGDGS